MGRSGERKGLELDERTRAAYHETGHALTGLGLRIDVREIVIPDSPVLQERKDDQRVRLAGQNMVALPRAPTPQQVFEEVQFLVAGCVAECILISRQPNRPSSTDLTWLFVGAHDDLVTATERLRKVSAESNHVGDALMNVRKNLEANWDRVRRVANVLLAKGRLTQQEIVDLAWPEPERPR